MSVWEKLFSKITFKDYPNTSTPLNADNLNKMTDAIDGIDNRVVELNSNLSYKGNYTGNIDELHELDKCGGYFVQVSNASGTQPFDSQFYYLEVSIESYGRLQRATQYNTGETKERYYTNNKWYSWTPAKQNAIHSNIAFASTGITTSANDGGYAIVNDNRRWRLHANGTKCWLHEFDLEGNILNYYTFENGNLTASGDLIDGSGNKLSDFATYAIETTSTVNNTYAQGTVMWARYGKMVIVSVYDMMFKANTTQSGTSHIIMSGLPKSIRAQATTLSSFVESNKGVRIGIDAGGTNLCVWHQAIGSTNLDQYNGQLIYFVAD